MNELEIRQQWRNAGMAVAAVMVVVMVAFFGTIKTLVLTWWDKPEYNYALLIIPVIIYLVYERREIFWKIAPKPSWLGLVLLLAGGAGWVMGDVADANVIRQFGLVILIQGCLLTILGRRVVLALLFPFFYMIFLIPFGDFLVTALQDFTTDFIVTILHLMNIPVYVEGVYISIPAGNFEVAEACAGLRFLVATVALGTLMANVAYKTAGRQIIVVILSFIVPVIANGFRATGIILIAHWWGLKYATGVDHIIFGWIFFAFVLLIFISISMTFTNRGLHDGYINFAKKYWLNNSRITPAKFIPFVIIAAVLTGIVPVYVSVIEQRYQAFEHYTLSPETRILGQDISKQANWKPYYGGASQTFQFRKQQAAGAVDTFIAYYKYQNNDSEMIRFGNGVVPAKIWEQVGSRKINPALSGLDFPVNEVILQSGIQRRLVWYWYWVDGRFSSSKYEAKLLGAKAELFGGRLDSAVIAVSALVDRNNIKQKRKQLAKLAASLPRFKTMISQPDQGGKIRAGVH